MKKSYLFYALAISLIALNSCNSDNDDIDVNSDLLENTIIEDEDTSLFEITPDSSLNDSRFGLYHGVFTTVDLSKRGKIYVYIDNNGKHRAELELLDGEILEFTSNATNNLEEIQFSNQRSSFIFNALDLHNPIATNVIIDDIEGGIQTFKDTSSQRISVILGTFVDALDSSFTGDWDIITNGMPHPDEFSGDGFEQIMSIVVSINGAMYTDTDPNQESWTTADGGCALQNANPTSAAFAPDLLFPSPGQGPYLEAFNQIAIYNGVEISWEGSINSPGSNLFSCSQDQGSWSTVGGGRSGTFTLL